MRIDIVTADEGYFGIYVAGDLKFWGRAEPFSMLETVLKQEVPSTDPIWLETHGLGSYGDAAVGWDPMPQRFEDIPASWWGNEQYTDPSFDDWEAAK